MDPLGLLGARVGLGCMRFSTEAERDEVRALGTIHAALDAGVRLFDTARAYGRDDDDLGHNERLLANALRSHPRGAGARVVTKGGMRRPGGAWRPDGRVRSLLADAEASASALGRPPDVWLLHAPDARTPLATSLRGLEQILARGLAQAVGLSNVNRTQLEAALQRVPIAALQVVLSPWDDVALRGGLVELCAGRGITLIAHTPLGGPGRVSRLARDPALRELAAECGASAQQVALAWLLQLAPEVVAIPGASRPETAQASAAAARLELTSAQRSRLLERFPSSARARPRARPRGASEGEVVLVMGIQGAGKTRAVSAWTERGYERLNRDERGGSLRALAGVLERSLAAGARRVVLDNTYLTRAARADALDAARRHDVPVRGLWLDTPPAQAQLNLCLRLIDRFGRLPTPDELRATRAEDVLSPAAHQRALRQLELPSPDEGFALLERVAFVRVPAPELRAGLVLPADGIELLGGRELPSSAAVLVLGWREGAGEADERALAERVRHESKRDVAVVLCPHPGGPPACWCRPPLPGAIVLWATTAGVDLARIEVVGQSAAFRALARTFSEAR